jgi:23S rRNA (uracil1939-C5)-methyltransferase
VEFLAGQAEDLLPKLVKEGLKPDVIVLDPPRKGVELPVVEAIALARPERVVYVSCNPATQARDAALFCEKGYRITRCQPVDMFCWTHGVENVLCFDRMKG